MSSIVKKSRVTLDKHPRCEGAGRILDLPQDCIEAIIGSVFDSNHQKPVSKAVRACKGFRLAWKGFLSSPKSSHRIVAWATCVKSGGQGPMSRLIRMGAACNPAVIASLASSDKTDQASFTTK